jgi:hypothetical protein
MEKLFAAVLGLVFVALIIGFFALVSRDFRASKNIQVVEFENDRCYALSDVALSCVTKIERGK